MLKLNTQTNKYEDDGTGPFGTGAVDLPQATGGGAPPLNLAASARTAQMGGAGPVNIMDGRVLPPSVDMTTGASPLQIPSPVAPGPAMPPGGWVKTGKSGSTSESHTQISDAERAARDKQTVDAEDAANEAQNRADRIAEQERKRTDARIADDAAADARRAETDKLTNEQIAARQNDYDAAVKARQNQDEKGLFEGRPGASILAAFSVALGARAATLSHGPNYAMQVIDRAVEEHVRGQQALAAKQREAIDISGKRLETAKGDRVNAFRESDIARESAYRASANKIEAMRAKLGDTEAGQRADQLKTQLLQKADEIHVQSAEVDRKQVTKQNTWQSSNLSGAGGPGGMTSSVTGKPATDLERQEDGYAERMATQLGILKQIGPLSDQGKQAIRGYLAKQKLMENSKGAAAIGALGDITGLRSTLEEQLTPKDRAAWQAITEFTSANLRGESGAAIGVIEEQKALDRFGGKVGDSPRDNEARLQAMHGVAKAAAARSYRPDYWNQVIAGGTPGASAGQPAQSGAPAGRPFTYKGKRGTLYPDGRFVVGE